jgi:serine/threonine protein kinase
MNLFLTSLHTLTDNLVGKGGHSEVYKGLIGQGQLVAVKRLKQSNSQDQLMNEFLMELGMLCQLSHPNITRFVGYCSDNGLYLVFQYLERGSLDSWLHGNIANVFVPN